MKLVLGLFVLFAGFSAQADIIKCSFTEPFLTLTYSMTQSTLTANGPEISDLKDLGFAKPIKNVSFQIMGPGKFELRNKKNETIMTLTLDPANPGSDGMSPFIYPYSAQLSDKGQWANLGFGGCTSNFQAATQGEI